MKTLRQTCAATILILALTVPILAGEVEARRALSDYWRRIGERPKLEGLEPSMAAEVLLRVGVLTGLIQSGWKKRTIRRRSG